MVISKEKILNKISIGELTQFLALFGLAVFTPSLLHVQWVTGPIVNSIFIITLVLLGLKSALAIALVPSLIALSSGTLPVILAPAIPFIMLSNAIYILSINHFFSNKGKSYWSGVFVGAGLKFIFLFLSSGFIIKLFTSETVALKIGQMMTWAQFVTALLGGMIAWIVLKNLKKI